VSHADRTPPPNKPLTCDFGTPEKRKVAGSTPALATLPLHVAMSTFLSPRGGQVSSAVSTAYRRMNAGTIHGDQEPAHRFLGGFFRI
jgi:hypothetical protein